MDKGGIWIMMAVMESVFDLLYLMFITFLGLSLLFEKKKISYLYAAMTLILALGDSFHLIPRIISHFSYKGFEANIAILSWGEFVTSIGMTIFYFLFYYYYRAISKDKSSLKLISIYILSLLRIILILLPQNMWGTKGDYIFSIIRNIPFLIMGILLIIFTFKHKEKNGLRNMYIYILLSFVFYIPVVLFARFIPVFGALMIPKTLAYISLIYQGYKSMVRKLENKSLIKFSIIFLIFSMIFGVFYREFTKLYSWNLKTSLSIIHPHLMILGFIFFLLMYILVQLDKLDINKIEKQIYSYIFFLYLLAISFFMRGIYVILNSCQDKKIDILITIVAGISHIGLFCFLLYIMTSIFNSIKDSNKAIN